MSPVFFSVEAEEDLLGIVDFIARDKPAAARKWLDHIRHTCGLLASQPEMAELRLDLNIPDCRCFSVGN